MKMDIKKTDLESLKVKLKDFKKKIKKNFFAGVGAGLIIAAISIIFIYSVSRGKIVSTMSNAQIIEKAKAMGMKFPAELQGDLDDTK